MNAALLLKWIWKMYQMDRSIWATLIRAKYTANGDIFSCPSRGGSQFWKNLHKIKHVLKLGAKYHLGSGHRIKFWVDWWWGEGPLSAQFPTLSNICENPLISVA